MNPVSDRVPSASARLGAKRDEALARPVHDTRTAALLGIALGISFTTCFVTGLYSHLLQHPLAWLTVPSRPAGLYRVTQGVHVATGLATIPLLLAKLWSVYPRFFRWPPVTGVSDVVERALLVPLVSGAVFQLFTGTANIARWYPFPFFFTSAHYWVAWITIGALVAHIGAKAYVVRDELRHQAEARPTITTSATGLSRRGFLSFTAAGAGFVTLTTVGQTLSPLRRFALFAPRRPDIGPQSLPVNRAAAEAGVLTLATDPAFRLRVTGNVARELSFTVADLEARSQHRAELPIACVEGWSANAHWSGLPIRELLGEAGVTEGAAGDVEVRSLEPDGLYAHSLLTSSQVQDGDTILALHLNGERLDLDHGYPCRLIAPNRPGVLQTKWVTELVVR